MVDNSDNNNNKQNGSPQGQHTNREGGRSSRAASSRWNKIHSISVLSRKRPLPPFFNYYTHSQPLGCSASGWRKDDISLRSHSDCVFRDLVGLVIPIKCVSRSSACKRDRKCYSGQTRTGTKNGCCNGFYFPFRKVYRRRLTHISWFTLM